MRWALTTAYSSRISLPSSRSGQRTVLFRMGNSVTIVVYTQIKLAQLKTPQALHAFGRRPKSARGSAKGAAEAGVYGMESCFLRAWLAPQRWARNPGFPHGLLETLQAVVFKGRACETSVSTRLFVKSWKKWCGRSWQVRPQRFSIRRQLNPLRCGDLISFTFKKLSKLLDAVLYNFKV